MQHRILGRTGIWVSKFALGTMRLGAWGNADHDDAARLVRTALDAGINLIDTADMYSGGEAEEIIGKAIAGRRDEVVLATKGHFPVRLDDETLDRIDEIVPPGVTLNPSDADYSPPALADSGLRRRTAGQR